MRARVAIAFVLALSGCSIFGGENDPKPDTIDAAQDSGVPAKPAPLLCGSSTCAATEKCCITDPGRKCDALCGGFDFACLGASQCEAGKVCCFSKNASRCQSSCTERTMCELDSECGASGICKAATCNPKELSFKSCAKGGSTFVDLPQNGSCSLP